MSRKITSAEWRSMQHGERRHALDSLVEAALDLPNGALSEVTAELQAFERRFGLTTSSMLERVGDGRLSESPEITDWLMLEHRRARLARHAAQSA